MKKKFLFIFFVFFFPENPVYSATPPIAIEEGVFSALGAHIKAISKRRASRLPVSLEPNEQFLFSGKSHVLFSDVQRKIDTSHAALAGYVCSRTLLRAQEKNLINQSINQTGCILKVTEGDIGETVRCIHDTTWNIKCLEKEIPLLEAVIRRNAGRLDLYITHKRLLDHVKKTDSAFYERLTTELEPHLLTILETLLPTS